MGWLATGAAGFLGGLTVLFLTTDPSLQHLAWIVTIGPPVVAFWRLMQPRLAPHCPRPPEPGSPL